jgi:uncharacterized membrane protein
MTLSPEERRKIYEEEKARIEAREQLERERGKSSDETSTGLMPNVAGLLCYVGAWITGIIFLVLEKKNEWVRFHAAQSLVTFGGLAVISAVIGWLPFIGWFFNVVIGITAFVLWIVLMMRAFHGERYHLPIAGDIAESIIAGHRHTYDYQPPPAGAVPPPNAEKPEPPPPPPSPATSNKESAGRFAHRTEDFFERRRAGRITGYAVSIAWCIALLIFFNYFWQYAAWYNGATLGGQVIFDKFPFFTSEINRWLPILTATLVVSIVSHIILIIYDRYTLRQAVHVITGVLGFATVVSLLSIFPFDFSVIPDSAGATWTQIGVIVVLVLMAVGLGIGVVVRFIKFVIGLVTGRFDYR